jgi:hypothetical protein
MDEWDFYILENSAIKLLLLQEGKEFWVHELFMETGTKIEYKQPFPGRISGSHGGEHEDGCLLGCCAV